MSNKLDGTWPAGIWHPVPLASAALSEAGDTDALIFSSSIKPDRMLSEMALTGVLRRMERGGLTVHGFRSTFRDWTGDTSGHPREVSGTRSRTG